jgi:hypothetical protein
MKKWLSALLIAAARAGVPADEPAPLPAHDVCQVPDNRILGPRTLNRPLPLLAGDPTGGFHPACAVPWTTLSPDNQPLKVVACYRGNLLQVANDSACGRGTGPLWVSLRWVVTSGQARPAQTRAGACQQLETGTYAATRDFQPDCVPQGAPQGQPARAPAPAGGAAPASAPASSTSPVSATTPASSTAPTATPRRDN